MPKVPELCRRHQRLRPLIALARCEGWKVCLTDEGLKLSKPDFPPIFTHSTASDYRAGQNALAQPRRAETPGDRND